MATIKEQEELIEVLKWTPRTYTMSIYGYGGEIAMGKINPETVDYFKKNLISVENYAYNYADEGDDEYIEVPEDLQPFTQGNWYDCDGIEHCSGAEFGGCRIEVRDENGDTVWEQDLDSNLEDAGCEVECFCEEEIDDYVNKDQAVFVGQSFEKGTFFDGEIDLKEPFDPSKFKFTYSDIAGWSILNVVEYDGEEIDGSGGYSTTGKSSEFKFFYENEFGDIVDYDSPSDEDYGVPEHGTSPDDWEKSPKFKFKQHKPVHVGWYSANWGYGSTYGSLYWNGENFVEFNYGKEHIIEPKSIVTWQGYNWDTTSWVNRPPVPPDVQCSNKKCGWIGNGTDRIEDDEYNDHCPECNGTDFDWIDYDPDTAKGRKNREKYCKEWDPVEALKRIPVPEPESIAPFPGADTMTEGKDTFDWSPLDDEDDDEPPQPDCECVQCEWRGTVDETSYDDDDNMICPECGETVELIDYGTTSWDWKAKDTAPDAPGEYDVLLDLAWPHGGPGRATWDGKTWKRGIVTVKINGWK